MLHHRLCTGAGHLFQYVTNQPPKANSAFHPSGVGKWVPALAGKAKAGMVHSVSRWTRGVQVKLWDPLRTRAIPEHLRGAFTTRRYTNPRLPLPLPYLCRLISHVLRYDDSEQRTSSHAAARLLTNARRCDHITPLLRQLHWLPVQRRVEFKIACIVHQSLASLAPTYLTTDIHLVSEYSRRSLRSSTDRTLTVPRTHNRFGDRSFAVAGPRLWNSLPISLRKISSYGQFRRYLKNHLFGIWEITAQCDAWFSVLYKYSYLLTYTPRQ